ncbi:MAG TPA: acetylpolyamine amidohydrolase [Alphaproteobacteria bacterium]|nr:acetylpolyamine amidohydrolase [Alphaproteobacteria bacterium]HAJ48162.1 acetylpolyamine amidohydrolase [Alphaproteobacteria bacterium]
MQIIYSPAHRRHAVATEFDGVKLIPAYEVPERAEAVLQALSDRRLGAIRSPEPFGLGPVARVHDQALIRFLETAFAKFVKKHGADVREAYPSSWPARRLRQVPGEDIDGVMGYFCFDTATPLLDGTWTAAREAVDCALTAAQLVDQGAAHAFALCRPPGHHAASDLYGGYCFFNNAAIAAQWLRDRGRRVAILDVDYHHGNGTQEIFYQRADVLSVSIHADPNWAFPHFLGFADERGEGAGEGFNLNVPLPYGTGWDSYAQALDTALAKVAAFGPEVLVLALGLDTFGHDPISKFRLQTEDYLRMGETIGKLGLPMVVTMEGGYALGQLGEITANALEGLLTP